MESGKKIMTMTASVVDGASAVIATGDSVFNLFLLKIVTQTPVDMTQLTGQGNQLQTISGFQIEPSASPVPAYIFTYTLGSSCCGDVPSWISIVDNTGIEIDGSTAVVGTYELELTGTVVGEPNRSKSVPFTVTVITGTTSTLINQFTGKNVYGSSYSELETGCNFALECTCDTTEGVCDYTVLTDDLIQYQQDVQDYCSVQATGNEPSDLYQQIGFEDVDISKIKTIIVVRGQNTESANFVTSALGIHFFSTPTTFICNLGDFTDTTKLVEYNDQYLGMNFAVDIPTSVGTGSVIFEHRTSPQEL